MTRIELAVAEDLPRIVELSNQVAAATAANFATQPEPVADWLKTWEATRATYPWLVVRDGGRVVGFAKASPHRARGAYRWTAEVSVYLDEAWHRRGVGSELYRTLLPLLRAQGYVTLLAGITAGHVASETLHQRFGFVRCGTYHRAGWKLGGWHDVGYWERHLHGEGEPREITPVADTVWIRREELTSDVAAELIGGLNRELSATYPEPGSNHFRLDPNEVAPARGAFLVARLGLDAVGCGAVRRIADAGDGAAEVKRMYVKDAARGRRVGTLILEALEAEARALGSRRIVLETGPRQRAAIAMYQRCGFVPIPAWGEYIGAPLSVCFGKDLPLSGA